MEVTHNPPALSGYSARATYFLTRRALPAEHKQDWIKFIADRHIVSPTKIKLANKLIMVNVDIFRQHTLA